MTPLSLALTKSTVPRCAIASRLREGWKLKSKSSSVLWGGELCGVDASSTAVVATSRCRHTTRNKCVGPAVGADVLREACDGHH